ncbi:MAG TPA: hypothetical protein VIG66_07060 [Noviherbaspirillum sp.]
MSEYQYYEFVAIDRPLTREEMAELRSRSSRATITATSFTNEYNWGDLKADPADWMRRYFDAFVYTANWCSCVLALRLPRDAIDKTDLKGFATEYALTIEDSGTHWIIKWSLEEGQDYDRFAMETGAGWMGSLVPLRDELQRGDLRALYLGWLAGVDAGEVKENAVEPEVPPGLSQLSAAQQALVEFLEIDPDLVAAAATGSREIEDCLQGDGNVEAWLAGLPGNEVKAVFNLLLQGASQQAERKVKSGYSAWLKERRPSQRALSAKRRTVAELHALAKEAENRRLEREAKEHARQEAERRRQREDWLRTLATDFKRHWQMADQQAERATAAGYDEATRIIIDLAEAYALVSKRDAFDQALGHFMARHGKRRTLVRRLDEAGLW